MRKIFLMALLVAMMSVSTVFAADTSLNFGATTDKIFLYHADQHAEATVKMPIDLHARPAAIIVQTASRFQSKVKLEAKGKFVDAKSLMMIMGMGLVKGTEFKIIADGSDSEQAVNALRDLINSWQ